MKRLITAVALAASLVGVAGCGKSTPHGPCIKSHSELVTSYVLVGKVLFPITDTETVCDKYAPLPSKSAR